MTIKDFYPIAQGYTYIYFSVNGKEAQELTPLFADLLGDCVIDYLLPGKPGNGGKYTIEDAGTVTVVLKTEIVRV